MAGWIDDLGDGVRKVIRAFHGSPYDFDKFDASKIGTGEGAQAYGHGLYFAGDEDVARSYRDALKTSVDQPVPRDLQNAYIEASVARSDFANRRGGWLQKNPRIPFPQQAEMDANETLFYDLQNRVNAAASNPGRMYEVAIDRPESSLLDWDAPISRQPKVIQKLFGDFAMDELGDGGRIYRDIATRHGEAFDDDMTGVLANLEASKELLAEGIPGIRYLDQGSRRVGSGTRNYVMFPGTEDSIRILRKYGLLAPVAAGTASSYNDEP